jgi:hypothetical protein
MKKATVDSQSLNNAHKRSQSFFAAAIIYPQTMVKRTVAQGSNRKMRADWA